MKVTANNKYISYGYSSFLYDWQNYYKLNFITFDEEIKQLKNNLDLESKNIIDTFIDKIIFKLKLPNKYYLIKNHFLFSDDDKKIIKKESLTKTEINNLRTKYKLPKNYLLQTSVFRYHNGLKILPKNLLYQIYNKIIIDGGAYYGDSSLIFTKYNPLNIYSFEPNSVNYNLLKLTIMNNKLNNIIIPINKGLYEYNGIVNLCYNSNVQPNLGAKICNNTTKKKETINLITIDSFVKKNNLQDIALIKLDIEGSELEAILGAKNTIKRYRPILLIAIYHNAEEFLNIKIFLENLKCNYRFLVRSLDHSDILNEIYLIAYAA